MAPTLSCCVTLGEAAPIWKMELPSTRKDRVHVFLLVVSRVSPALDISSANARVPSHSCPLAPGRAQRRSSVCLLNKPPGTLPAPKARTLSPCPQWPLGHRVVSPAPLPLPRTFGKASQARWGWGGAGGWRVMDRQAQREELSVHSSHPTSCSPPGPPSGTGYMGTGGDREQMSPIAEAVPTLLELPDPNQHSRSTGPPSGTLSAPTHCVTSGNASVSPAQGVLGWMTPKSLPHQDSVPCVGSTISHPSRHPPKASGHLSFCWKKSESMTRQKEKKGRCGGLGG